MQLDFGNSLSELKNLARALEAFGEQEGLSPETIGVLNLALDELFTNIVQHSYGPGKEGTVSLRLSKANGSVRAVLQDTGPAYNPFEAPEPDTKSSIESRPVGGLGVYLVKKLMDDWEYRRDADQNTIILHKNLA